MFRRAVQRGRLSQAYLFVGPDGVGKQLFARRLAQCLLCRSSGEDSLEACRECSGCKPFTAGSHPDFLFVGCPEGKRELPIELLVGSKERRGQEGLCHDLSVRPLAGSRKIAVINDADTMNEASANALLKTLEEPPERAILLLLAANLDAVLPTIRSRCQLVRFSPLPPADVAELLIEHDLVSSPDDAQFAAALSEGSLTIARQLLEPELRALRSTLFTALASNGFSGLSLSRLLMEGIDRISSDTPAQRVNVQWLIRFIIEFYRAALWALSANPDGRDIAGPVVLSEASTFAGRFSSQPESIELLGTLIDRSIDAAGQIDQNISVALCLDTLLDDLARVTRLATSR